MQAAHHAGMEPMSIGEMLDGFVGAVNAGIEKDEKIDAGDGDDPEKEEAQRTKLRDRIESRPEQTIERALDQFEPVPQYVADCANHSFLRIEFAICASVGRLVNPTETAARNDIVLGRERSTSVHSSAPARTRGLSTGRRLHRERSGRHASQCPHARFARRHSRRMSPPIPKSESAAMTLPKARP